MFNTEEHTERIRIINYGREKWPQEKNITRLYEMACKELGIEVKKISTATGSHLPTPEESARQNPDSPLVQICPKCGKKSYVPSSICPGCKDSEGGKYKAMFECFECNCKEKFDKWLVQVLNEKGIEIPDGMKRHLGIRTVTDGGLR